MIKITPRMFLNDVEIVSLENYVDQHRTLKEAMQEHARESNIKLLDGFWKNHAPLGIIKNSLLYSSLVSFYVAKHRSFDRLAPKNIHGFVKSDLSNTSPYKVDRKFGFFFHIRANSDEAPQLDIILKTLLKHVGSTIEFMKFVNRNVGYRKE